MEANETLRKMRDMRMGGMADAYSEQMADRRVYDQMTFDDRIGILVDAENDRRLATKLANLIKGAKLRFPDARSESVVYDPRRGIEKEAMARYFSCAYIDDAADIVITGPTGSGNYVGGWIMLRNGLPPLMTGLRQPHPFA